MIVASQTPGGIPKRCPVCGKIVWVALDADGCDAPCPNCGSLLWFGVTTAGVLLFKSIHVTGEGIESPPRTIDRSANGVGDPPGNDDRAGLEVKIIGGHFTGICGTVHSRDLENQVVSVLVEVFGRTHTVCVKQDDVEFLG